MFLKTAILPIVFALLAGPSARGDSLSDEEYLIYSAAIDGIRLSHQDNGMFVIVREVLDPKQMPDIIQDCSSFPQGLIARVENVRKTKQERFRLGEKVLSDTKLVIRRRYVLVSLAQGSEWLEARSQPKIPLDGARPEEVDRFRGTSDLIRVSGILFNSDRTLALIYLSARCGNLCGSSGWVVVEKRQGTWRVLQTPNCGTVN